MSSLRRDLTLSLAIGIGSANLLAGWLLLVLFRANSRDDFDAALLAKAGALGTLLERTENGVEFDFADEVMPEFHREREPEYFEIWIEDAVFERSRSLGERDLPRRTGPAAAPELFDLVLPDGRSGRAVGLRPAVDFADHAVVDRRAPQAHAELVVAIGRESLDRGDARILHALLVSGVALAAAGILVVAIALRRCTRRIGALTERLAKVDVASLDSRIATGGVVTELRPIAETLDSLLDRLRLAFAREQRMTSNIAHELRTPVAELRAAVDVALQWPDDPELSAQAIRAAASVSVRMSSVIDALLRLGRLQAGRYVLEIAEIDVARSIRELLAEVAPGGAGAGRVQHRGVGEAIVRGDGPLVRVLARNLLENAIAHSPDGSLIVSELRRSRRVLRWRLTNAVGDLAASDVRLLSEPFWQGTGAPPGESHNGLGLSLCQAICRALGWRLRFRLEDGALAVCLFMRSA